MNPEPITFHEQYDVSRDAFDLWVRVPGNEWGSKNRYFLGPATAVAREFGGSYPDPVEPFIRGDAWDGTSPSHGMTVRSFFQAALDHAWSIGMRPTGYDEKVTEKQLSAITYHLEDMRRIAFKSK